MEESQKNNKVGVVLVVLVVLVVIVVVLVAAAVAVVGVVVGLQLTCCTQSTGVWLQEFVAQPFTHGHTWWVANKRDPPTTCFKCGQASLKVTRP